MGQLSEPEAGRPAVDGALRDAAHIALLATLAISYPALDVLGREAEFFTAHQATSRDMWVYAVLVAFVVPAVLIAVDVLSGARTPRLHRVVHLGLVAVLSGLFVSRGLRTVTTSAVTMLAGSVLAAAVVTYAFVRHRTFRDALSWGAPAPLVVAALFLFSSRAAAVVSPGSAQESGSVSSTAPIVFALFDEFPSPSLMDPSYGIDAQRLPNIASLAREAYWFRNATSVDDFTPYAVPALLTGMRPPSGKDVLPTAASHPNSLFTTFGRSYEMHVEESVTDLCPATICALSTTAGERVRSLVKDSAVVYAHLVVPPSLARGLPSISNSWGDFGVNEGESPEATTGTAAADAAAKELKDKQAARFKRSEDSKFERLLASIDGRPASLYFTHFFLPHLPWRGLPTGQTYPNAGPPEGLESESGGGRWGADAAAMRVGLQRHLLQVGYVDHLVGRLIRRLKDVGIYDDALIVLASDHGASFVPTTGRRAVGEANADHIMPSALIVKAPHQRQGVISDRNVETVDLLPTIADLLDIDLAYKPDGTSAVDARIPDRTLKVMKRTLGGDVRRPGSRPARFALADQIAATFPRRGDRFDLYAFGPATDLLGKPLAQLRVGDPVRTRVVLRHPEVLADVDPSGRVVPVYATGTVRGAAAPATVALVLNGAVAATGATFGDKASFSLLFPPSLLRPGSNDARLYLVTRDAAGALLHPAA